MLDRSKVLQDAPKDDAVLTPVDEKQLIEDCKKFSDDGFSILDRWYEGKGDLVYPLIIEAMKKIGDTLMTYEEHHLANTIKKLREGIKDA